MKYLESFTLLVFGFGFLFYLMRWPGGSVMIITSLGSLSAFYFLFGFNFLNNVRLRNSFKKESYQNISTLKIIGGVLAGINLSVLLTGNLFGLMRWPGFTSMLIITLISSLIILVISLIKQFKDSNNYIRIISRTVFFLGLASLLYFKPIVLQEIRFKDEPRILNAYKRYYDNPTEENDRLIDKERDRNYLTPKEFNDKYKDSI